MALTTLETCKDWPEELKKYYLDHAANKIDVEKLATDVLKCQTERSVSHAPSDSTLPKTDIVEQRCAEINRDSVKTAPTVLAEVLKSKSTKRGDTDNNYRGSQFLNRLVYHRNHKKENNEDSPSLGHPDQARSPRRHGP